MKLLYKNVFNKIKKFYHLKISKKRYYRLGSCNCCGACCENIYVRHNGSVIKTEEEFYKVGVNIVIYANHLTRSAFPAMKKTAETILYNKRAKEADEYCMSIKEILTLIPEE